MLLQTTLRGKQWRDTARGVGYIIMLAAAATGSFLVGFEELGIGLVASAVLVIGCLYTYLTTSPPKDDPPPDEYRRRPTEDVGDVKTEKSAPIPNAHPHNVGVI